MFIFSAGQVETGKCLQRTAYQQNIWKEETSLEQENFHFFCNHWFVSVLDLEGWKLIVIIYNIQAYNFFDFGYEFLVDLSRLRSSLLLQPTSGGDAANWLDKGLA